MLSFLIVSILIVIFLGYDTQEPKVCKATKEINDMKNVKFWTPFKRIPNVRDFKVIVSNWDKLFLLFGIKKRSFKAKLVYRKYQNNRLNRYMSHQLKRLYYCQDPNKYWRIAYHLMDKSEVFFCLALNHVFPR